MKWELHLCLLFRWISDIKIWPLVAGIVFKNYKIKYKPRSFTPPSSSSQETPIMGAFSPKEGRKAYTSHVN
jgi:hypothetical protein